MIHWAPIGYIIWFNAHINGSEKLNNLPKVAQQLWSKDRIWTRFYLTPGALPSAALKGRKQAAKQEMERWVNQQTTLSVPGYPQISHPEMCHSGLRDLVWIIPSTPWGFENWGKTPLWAANFFIYKTRQLDRSLFCTCLVVKTTWGPS